MVDKHIIAAATFATDAALPCVCGSTITAYKFGREPDGCRRVDVQWCFRTDYFFPRDTPTTAAECSAAHRKETGWQS